MSHKRQPIRLLAESSDSVMLRRAGFAAVIEGLEDPEDQIAVLGHQLALEKGAPSRLLTMDGAERLIAGESPVKIWREKDGLTQRDLASAAEVSQSHLAEIETGAKTGSVETLRKRASSKSILMLSCLCSRARRPRRRW